ncbi:YciI family protein [uncultured Devosia sp.]|uniref:YciI family protein n=2 Tax=Devosiaceae TaxID=2831106 RepID=UPI0030EC856C
MHSVVRCWIIASEGDYEMRYMCLVIIDKSMADSMTPVDWTIMNENSQSYDRELKERGVYVHAEALMGPDTARTVRVRADNISITDGPFTESKELVGGFILIDVADESAAMDVAQNIPMARLGAVEVRPVMAFS